MSIHPTGDRIMFSAEVPDRGAAVFMSQAMHGTWTTPEQISLTAGARKNEMEAFFSPDGRSLYFAPYDEGMDVRIWMADLTSAGWENPRPVGPPVNQDPAFYPVQASDGTLYYTNLAQRAVYRATLGENSVLSAEPAGLEVGGHAFPAPDSSYMLVDSASLDSDAGRDIFVAFRHEDGSWGSPQPLGSAVNTEHSETCPSLSPDGRFLFFSRYNEPGDISNIYWISSQVIQELPPAAK
jgi:Tol biopolymer transport system component